MGSLAMAGPLFKRYLLGAVRASWHGRRGQIFVRGLAAKPESLKAAERAKQAQQLWDMAVPERNWTVHSPMIPVMVLLIVGLQVGISLSGHENSEEHERAEALRLRE